jgi:hypothetical protein
MDAIQHNPARLYNCNETGIAIIQHKHTKILGLKGKRQISPLQSAERESFVKVVTCMSAGRHFISPLLVVSKKNIKRTDESHTACIKPRLPPLGVDTERDFFSGFFISSKVQSRQKKILLS